MSAECGRCRNDHAISNVNNRAFQLTWASPLFSFSIRSLTSANAAAYPFEREIGNVQFRVARVPATSANCRRSRIRVPTSVLRLFADGAESQALVSIRRFAKYRC